MNVVRRGEVGLDTEILGGTGRRLPAHLGRAALEKAVKFNEELNAARRVPLDEIRNLTVESKGDLVLKAADLFSIHAVPLVAGDEDKETMRHASLAGCGVIVAYQDMVARMLAKKTGCVYDEGEYRSALKASLPTVMTIAATSREADGALTTNIMNWSRAEIEHMDDREIYAGLGLDETFFIMREDGGVELIHDDATRRRITMSGRQFDFTATKYHVLLGCPFRSRIAQTYEAIGEAMIRNGFSQEAYDDVSTEGYQQRG